MKLRFTNSLRRRIDFWEKPRRRFSRLISARALVNAVLRTFFVRNDEWRLRRRVFRRTNCFRKYRLADKNIRLPIPTNIPEQI